MTLIDLRDATRSQNLQNVGALSSSKSGVRGVHWSARDKRWVAQIRDGKKTRHLGCFKQKEAAARAYTEAAKRIHGAFFHGQVTP